MTNNSDYRLYLDQRFNDVDKTLARIEEQTTKTNSRVTHLEEKIGVLEKQDVEHIINCPVLPRVEKIEDDMSEYKGEKRAKTTMKEWSMRSRGEKRAEFMKVLQTIGIIIAAIGLLITAYNSFNNLKHVQGLKTEVDLINTPVRTRGGSIMMIPSGVMIDSVKQNTETDVKEIKEPDPAN